MSTERETPAGATRYCPECTWPRDVDARGCCEFCGTPLPAAPQPRSTEESEGEDWRHVAEYFLGKDFVGTHTAKECRAEAVRRSVASARSTEGAEADAIAAIRDDVLHQRGPLAENGMSSEQVNDVLAVIDSYTPASPPVPQEREGLVERINGALVDPLTRRAAGMNALTRHLCELLQEAARQLSSPADASEAEREFIAAQTPLDPDAERILRENLWDLYDGAERAEASEPPSDRTQGDGGEAVERVHTILHEFQGTEHRVPDGWCDARDHAEAIAALFATRPDPAGAAVREALPTVRAWIVTDRWGEDMDLRMTEPRSDGIRGIVPVEIRTLTSTEER